MLWYRQGTVSVSNGSPLVTGAGTNFTGLAPAGGDLFTLDGQKFYEILSAQSLTQLTLNEPYTGATASGQGYAIIRNFQGTLPAQLAANLYDLLLRWEASETEKVAWLSGTYDGGPGHDGRYPITQGNVTTLVKSPARLEFEYANAYYGSLKFVGDWVIDANYQQNNIVAHRGAIWMAKEYTSLEPGVSDKWVNIIPTDGVQGIVAEFEWHFVAGVPAQNLGVNSNLALNTLTGMVYKKEGGVWVPKGVVSGPAGPTGPTGPDGNQGEAGPADTALSSHRIVRVLADGRVAYASADDLSDTFSILGISLNAAMANDPVMVRTSGRVEFSGWSWTPEQPIFLGLNGFMTQTPDPSGLFLIQVGFAESQTSMHVRIGRPIFRS